MTRKMLSEWSRRRIQMGLNRLFGGRRLSADPVSYRYLVEKTMTTTPDQSAMALPKNEPRWVWCPETLYRQIHNMRTPAEARLSECSRMNPCLLGRRPAILISSGEGRRL